MAEPQLGPPSGRGRAEGAGMSEASAIGLLLRGLFDDASLFPPAELAMPDALAARLRHQAAWYRELTGPFVCADIRIPQLRAAMSAANMPEIELALIVTGSAAGLEPALEAVVADPRLALRAVELPISRDGGAAPAAAEAAAALDKTALSGAAAYIEIPVPVLVGEVIAIVADHGYRAKLRTGGTTAAAFPSEQSLAACIDALAAARLQFKCTAGLHHAVRHTAADTGFEHHGFLNVLLAVAAALDGAGQDEVAAVLAERDPARVAAAAARLTADAAGMVRDLFRSLGSCSTDEPVADLVALGLARLPG
jgi:hypothetical protein